MGFDLPAMQKYKTEVPKCSLCPAMYSLTGARVQCAMGKCTVAFHPTCAVQKGFCTKGPEEQMCRGVTAGGKYSIFCATHSEEQKKWIIREAGDWGSGRY